MIKNVLFRSLEMGNIDLISVAFQKVLNILFLTGIIKYNSSKMSIMLHPNAK